MDNVTRNYERVNRFFNSLSVENMKKVKPSFDKYLEKASGLHEEFADLLKKHGAKILGCDESCIDDCLDVSFVSFWEIPMCLKNCQCTEGLITIDRSSDSILGKRSLEEDEEFLGKKTYNEPLRTRRSEFNLPELMKYSEHDRKAWNFFKRYQDNI